MLDETGKKLVDRPNDEGRPPIARFLSLGVENDQCRQSTGGKGDSEQRNRENFQGGPESETE